MSRKNWSFLLYVSWLFLIIWKLASVYYFFIKPDIFWGKQRLFFGVLGTLTLLNLFPLSFILRDVITLTLNEDDPHRRAIFSRGRTLLIFLLLLDLIPVLEVFTFFIKCLLAVSLRRIERISRYRSRALENMIGALGGTIRSPLSE